MTIERGRAQSFCCEVLPGSACPLPYNLFSSTRCGFDLHFGLAAFRAPVKQTDYAREQAMKNVSNCQQQQYVAGIEKDNHGKGDDENNRPHAAAARTNGLQAREAKRTDHQNAEKAH